MVHCQEIESKGTLMELDARIMMLKLLLNIASVEEVVAWADTVIGEMERPPLALLEISLGASKPKHELIGLLNELARSTSGPEISAKALRSCIASLHSLYVAKEKTSDEVVRCLIKLTVN